MKRWRSCNACVDGGDTEAAQEYVVAARPIAARAARNADLAMLERLVEPKETKVKRAMAAAMDTLDSQTGWFDGHLTDALERAGRVSQAVREGREPDAPMDTRRVDLWLGSTEAKMLETFDATADGDAGDRCPPPSPGVIVAATRSGPRLTPRWLPA